MWEPAKSLSTLRKATQRARSQHVHGDLEGEVLTNAEASAYPSLGPARTVAAGAVLVEAHYKPGSSDLVILFVMEKKPPGFDPEGGDWEYLVVEPSGVIRHQAHATLCARCHAEAPNDHLFGVAH